LKVVAKRRVMMAKKIILSVLVVLLAAGLSACSVMQGTYQKKADEADTLTKRLAALQRKHDDLAAENVALKVRNERLISDLSGMTLQKDKLATDLAYVTGQRDKAAADKEEVDKILQAKSDSLSQAIFELRRKVADLDSENAKLRERHAALEKEIATLKQAKEEQVQKVSSTYESLLEKMKSEISKGQVTISELKGKLTVNMVDSILFDSGKAEVKEGGLEILRKVISILKDVNDKSIRIEGHTDDVQIVGALAKRYPTNWELSAARAINVARYLQSQKIDPGQLSAVAYGEWKPVATNDTAEGKAKNRRIEIILVPKE
jgi:chemotaxis protein MotB